MHTGSPDVVPPQVRALAAFREQTGRWPRRTAPYPTMPYTDAADRRTTRRTERQWLDFTERELANFVANQRQVGTMAEHLDVLVPGWAEPRTRGHGASNDSRWRATLARCAQFVVEHGRRPSKRSSDADEQHLARWLQQQRDTAATMSEDRRDRLDAGVPGWDRGLARALSPGADARFTRRVDDLAAFRAQHDTWPSTRSPLKHERSLAVWLRDQRRGATPERRTVLTEKMPGWDVPRRWAAGRPDDAGFEKGLAELREHIARTGHLPRRSIDSEARLLGWTHSHRYRPGQPERRARVEEVLAAAQPRGRTADQRVADLVAFVAEHGRLPRDVPGESALYSWLRRQRSGCGPEVHALLDEQIPIWRTSDQGGPRAADRTGELAEFVRAHGRLPQAQRVEERSLYRWMARQRRVVTTARRAWLDEHVPGWRGGNARSAA